MEKKEELFKIKKVEGTPFHIAEKDKKYCVIMAQYKVSKDFGSYEKAEHYIMNKPWELLTMVIGIMIEQINTLKN